MASLAETFTSDPIELWEDSSEDNLQLVIRAVYRQVLGNAHVLESQRLESAESMLRNGDISVRNFVRMVAQSELYQSLFFNSSSSYRFIELNCKHLLGRAPLDQAEISRHVQIYNEQGYEAEINSYIDSEEYDDNFGENVVPYPRAVSTQTGIKNVVFNRTLSLLSGFASSDNSNKSDLIPTVASNLAQKIKVTTSGVGGAYTNTAKKFEINVTKSGVNPMVKQGKMTYIVGYEQLSQKIKNIQKTGGKIISISEVS